MGKLEIYNAIMKITRNIPQKKERIDEIMDYLKRPMIKIGALGLGGVAGYVTQILLTQPSLETYLYF
jgi:hypothetical protein